MQVRLAWQQLPQLAGVAIAHRGKMGVMVTQFWQQAAFSVFRGRDSGQNSQPMRPQTVLNSARSLRLDPFPAEWKVVSPARLGCRTGWSEFRTHWKSGSEVILILKLRGTTVW